MSEEWGPWIEHDGKGCPVKGLFIHGVFNRPSGGDTNPKVSIINGGWEVIGIAGGGASWVYDHREENPKILRYRIRRPRALLQLIEMVENLPAPAQPRVDA